MKKKTLVLSDGSRITVHEITVAGRLELQGLDRKVTTWDLFRLCLDQDDLEKLNNIGNNKNDTDAVTKAILDVNSWGKEKEDEPK